MGPYFCDMDKCKMAKLCDKKRYIHHLGTVHKELELKLVHFMRMKRGGGGVEKIAKLTISIPLFKKNRNVGVLNREKIMIFKGGKR